MPWNEYGPGVAVCAILLAACGGDDTSADAGRADAARVDGGMLEIDAGMTPSCPAEPPADMGSCAADGLSCTWLRCEDSGETRAECAGGQYTVTAAACEPVPCGSVGGDTCGPSQICFRLTGGAKLPTCRENPCGDRPIEPACACMGCSGACSVTGRTVVCNTCPSGKCP